MTYAALPSGAADEVCYDAAGNIPWERLGDREFALAQTTDERTAIDSRGNRVTTISGLEPGGPKARTGGADTSAAEFQFRSGARWFERRIKDAGGEAVASAVELGSTSLLPARLQSFGLGISSPISNATQGERAENGGTTTWSQTGYARISDWVRTDPIPAGQDTVVQRIEHSVRRSGSLARLIKVVQTARADGLLRTEDSLGGSRTESYDAAGLLIEAIDSQGPIAQLEVDATGAPSILFLGEHLAVRYYWGDQAWRRKEVFDPSSGQLIFAVDSTEIPDAPTDAPENLRTAPMQVTELNLTNFGPVVQWDDDFGGMPTQAVSLGQSPYLFRPLEGTEPVWRSLTPLAGWGVDDRVDYTDGQFRLHLIVRNGTWSSLEPHQVVLEADRGEQAGATLATSSNILKSACTGRTQYVTEYVWANNGVTVVSYEVCIVPNGGGTRFNARENLPEQHAERQAMKYLDQGQKDDLSRAIAGISAALAKPKCRDLFKFAASRNKDNPGELLNRARFRNGLGISVRSQAGGGWHPCAPLPGERPLIRASAFMAGPNRSTVFLCDDFFQHGDSEGTMTVVHEMLHMAGLEEDMNPNTRTIMSTEEIAAMVRAACR